MTISAEEIKRLFNYDPITGEVTWAVDGLGRRRKGQVAGHMMRRYRYVAVQCHVVQHHKIAFVCMTGELPPTEIDHINGNPRDNRWENLRLATRSQQCANRITAIGASGYRGVVVKPSGKFEAKIKHHGTIHYIGSFPTAELAARAFDQMAVRLHGEFAVTNFPGYGGRVAQPVS